MFGPLVRLEADHDRAMKEAQARTGVTVRWDRGANQRPLARFVFPKEQAELRLTTGAWAGAPLCRLPATLRPRIFYPFYEPPDVLRLAAHADPARPLPLLPACAPLLLSCKQCRCRAHDSLQGRSGGFAAWCFWPRLKSLGGVLQRHDATQDVLVIAVQPQPLQAHRALWK